MFLNSVKRLTLFTLLLTELSTSAWAVPDVEVTSVTPEFTTPSVKQLSIAILDTLDRDSDSELLAKLVKRLNETSKNYQFRLLTLSTENIENEISLLRPDFMLAPASFAAMTNNNISFYRLATLKNDAALQPQFSQGALIITLAARHDLHVLKDLSGRIIGSSVPFYLPVWLSAMDEFQRSGMNIKQINNQSVCTAHEQRYALDHLDSGKIDALILPTCLLEQIQPNTALWRSKYTVLNEKTDGTLACARSTDLYPDVSLIGFNWTNLNIAKSLTIQLLNTPATGNLDWVPYVPHDNIDKMYRNLHLGPYHSSVTSDLLTLYSENQAAVHFSLLALLLLISYSSLLQHLVRKRTRELSESIKKQKKSEEEALKQRTILHQLERRNVVNQMSAMIAHEIKSPIATICNYKTALDILLPPVVKNEPKIASCLTNIFNEARRISEIIDRVRKYAQSKTIPHHPCDFVNIIHRAIKSMSSTTDVGHIRLNISPNTAMVLGDPLELELLVLNILQNASQVSTKSGLKCVDLDLKPDTNNYWLLEVRDYGLPLDDAEFEHMQKCLKSVKPEGLGMGLSIVRGITDSHGASINFVRHSPHGLSVLFKIPAFEESSKEKAPKIPSPR